MRAIELYHVKGNGWNDIGYNFLVDRFGTVYEGRYGGIEQNVVGAHARGVQHRLGRRRGDRRVQLARGRGRRRGARSRRCSPGGSTSRTSTRPRRSPFISGGNARFAAGLPVFLRTVSGHRDTGFTDCPGTALYNLLNSIAGEVSRIGLPKLYAPTVSGAVPGTVRFRAKLSSPLPWIVDVYDAAGNAVASSNGTGANVDWTWDATAVAPGSYTYLIRSDQSVTPAEGVIGGGDISLAIAGLSADPETVSPNGDTISDSTTITYTLNTAANVAVASSMCSAPRWRPSRRAWKRAGEHVLRFDPAPLPDGIFRIELAANATGGRVSDVVDAAGRDAHARQRRRHSPRLLAQRRRPRRPDLLQVLAGRACGGAAADPEERQVGGDAVCRAARAGVRKVDWNGIKRVGKLVDGMYEAILEATDPIATSTVALPFAADTRQPKLRIVQRSPLQIWVSEPARLTLRFGARSLVYDARVAGTARIPNAPRLGIVRAVAWDPAGNKSIPASKR